MATYQCPRCVLRFLFRSEVEAHLASDHRRDRLRRGNVMTGEPKAPATMTPRKDR